MNIACQCSRGVQISSKHSIADQILVDNILLFADSHVELQTALNNVSTMCSEMQGVNVNKTKALSF